jgi:hypothetical protein
MQTIEVCHEVTCLGRREGDGGHPIEPMGRHLREPKLELLGVATPRQSVKRRTFGGAAVIQPDRVAAGAALDGHVVTALLGQV